MNEVTPCQGLTERFARSVELARQWHGDQRRKGTPIPYLSHLLAVASLAIEDAASDPELWERLEDIAIAAVLHDLIEDTKAKAKDVEAEFGPEVRRIVVACSDRDSNEETAWDTRKQRYISRLEEADAAVLCVSLADKRHNARCIVKDFQAAKDSGNEDFWDRFNAGPADQSRYYTALAEVLCRRRPGAAADELESTVRQLELLTGP